MGGRSNIDMVQLEKGLPASMLDVVYCDAAYFERKPGTANVIIGILYGKQLVRIRAHAKNNVIAELLAILMARKLYPGKLIVNDCKAVTDMLNEKRGDSLKKLLGNDAQIEFLLGNANICGVLWQRRRSDLESSIVDSITRRHLGGRFYQYLERHQYNLKIFGF
jgi:hypothetical protein